MVCADRRIHQRAPSGKLKEQLLRRYPDARVIEFPGEDSYWVRIRPEATIASRPSGSPGNCIPQRAMPYLTRLD